MSYMAIYGIFPPHLDRENGRPDRGSERGSPAVSEPGVSVSEPGLIPRFRST